MLTKLQKCSTKLNILTKLKRRNGDEKSFSKIVLLTNSLFDTVDFLQKENLRLRFQNEKLEHENSVQDQKDSSSLPPLEQISLLEKKVYLLQQELTEVHKKKNEFTQQVFDLRNALDIRNEELFAKQAEFQEVERLLLVSEEICKDYDQKFSEVQLNLQTVQNEYDALLLSYLYLREQSSKLSEEHKKLISEWVTHKAKVADEFNAVAEQVQKTVGDCQDNE